jgi:hypothetical protein
MKEKIKTDSVKIAEVGNYVTHEYYEKQVNSYKKEFLGTSPSFAISKSLIKKVINMSSEVKGIRFMFGLADKLNPNSIRILLVPCGSDSEYSTNNQAIVFGQGYYDHLGENHSILKTSELISCFVKDVKARHQELDYKTITRGGFFGKNKILDLIKDDQCSQIMLHLAYQNEVIHPIIEPLDISNNSIGEFMNYSHPCPPACMEPDSCMATKAVQQHSLEKELDTYRAFRDEYLLNLEDGGIYYEMYYFISPFISCIVESNKNKEEILNDIYYKKITPFHNLLAEHKYEEALEFLKETLFEWIENYKLELIKS